jgi:hypothetical protein
MYLDKAVNEDCPGGYVVGGTTLEGEARNSDTVKFMIGGQEQTYKFSNGEQFRFTIWGDQNQGEVMIDQFEMTSLTFTVKFEVRPDRDSPWVTPTTRQFNPAGGDVIGPTTEVSIDAINKNLLNEDSTLAYRHPTQCSDNQTLLRLNGEVRIDADPDDTYLEFTNLHEVHDNRYGEGLNTMWIYLMPDRDYILAQGVCVYP